MKEQKRATLPLVILLGAAMILVPVVAGSGGGLPESNPAGGPAGGEGLHSAAVDQAHAQGGTPVRARAIFLLALLLVTSAATADVLCGELTRRRTTSAAGEGLHAKLHGQAQERMMN